jgi:carboxymethylenebutenolidase
MTQRLFKVATPDGTCPVDVIEPRGPKRGAVLVFMDALGMRPGLIAIGETLADAGYQALVPDLFYRFGPYAALDPKEVFAGDFRAVVGPMMATTDASKAAQDAAAILADAAIRNELAPGPIGVVGFCMGGGMALAAAALLPDRVAAAASFHGGNLATDAANSPHLLAPQIKAEVYIAGADNDRSYPPEMAARLDSALTAAGVRHSCEIYEGAAHGWMMPDFPVYDEAAARRGWTAFFDLAKRTIG